jgi:hypothetical protein
MKRSITSAVVAGALLLGVACSGGGLSPNPGTKVTLPTPKSVSPATIKAPAMTKTAIQSAGAMTSRTPASTIVPQSWSQIPGTATQVAAATDGTIWVLSDQPSGTDKYIWQYSNGTWTNITGLASQIAIAPNGTLYAINSAGGIYAYSGGNWTSPGGGAKSIAALADNSIVVVSNAGSGDQGIWRNDGVSWTQLPGQGIGVYAGNDTSSHTVNGSLLNPGGAYILNAAGQIYYENTDSSFALLPSDASSLTSAPGGLFAFGAGGIQPSGNVIYYFDLDTPGWSSTTGSGVSFSSYGGQLYVIAGSGGIYQTPITAGPTPTPTTGPTSTPTTGPTATPTVAPTATPTVAPTATPTVAPTATPTVAPTATPTVAPTATPTIAPTAAPLVVTPNPISLTQTGNFNVGVSESGFNGPITAVSGDTSIVTVASSPVTMTAGSVTVVVNALNAGSTTLTVSDGTQIDVVTVHVTLTGVIINHSKTHKH